MGPVDTHSTPVLDFGQEAVGCLCSPRAQYTTGTRATRTEQYINLTKRFENSKVKKAYTTLCANSF